MTRTARFLAASVLGLSACDIFDLDERRVLGTLYDESTPSSSFIVPESVAVGVEFTVTVITAVGPCGRGGGTDIRIDDRTAVVTPYDIEEEFEVCITAPPRPFAHETAIVFAEPGEAEVTLRARGRLGGPIELTKTVLIY